MVLCAAVCAGLAAAMLFLRKRPVWDKIRSPCKVLFVFGIMGILAAVSGEADSGADGIASGRIARKAPGEGELETEAYFYLEEAETEYPVTLTIEERKYRKEEEKKLLLAAIEEIEQTFCGTNESFDQILSNPVVSESYQEGAVTAEWSFSERAISSEGEIQKEELKRAQEVKAFVTLSCGESEELYRFSFQLVPEIKSGKEAAILDVEEQIALQEETEAFVVLPERASGQKITWKQRQTSQTAEILGLGILAAAAAFYAEKEKKEKQKQKRKQKLLLAYPEFVSKLSLLLGAGMSISRALRKMNEMYARKKEKGGKEEAVYEELYRMVCEIDNGMGELRAYREFSERCNLQPYRKLISLLVFGQKVGNRKLMEQLNEEADRVFAERKNTARRLGEEAGTKMLIPMMMMLVVVMGIIIIPAFLSFYGK